MFTSIFITLFIILIFTVFYKGYKNTQRVKINHISISNSSSTKTDSLPFHILHISDMHLENISISPEQLYKHLKDQKIDMIALTGDYLDRKRTIPKLVPYLKVFQQLNPKHGIYAVFGNHDYVLRQPNFIELKKVLEDNGCKTMKNEKHVIFANGQKINIIGIDDSSTNRHDLSKSYKDVTNGYNLVLTHDPNIVLEMKDFHFDYLLSGHFHGGQIHWPKPYHLVKMGKLVRMNMVKGLHQHDGKSFYISEGLGQTGLNIRFGSQPEITFHNLMNIAETKHADVEAV